MSDLQVQIRAYIENTIERIDSDDVVAAVAIRSDARDRSAWYIRPVWVAAGAAVIVSIAVGLPILFLGSRGSIVVVEPSTTVASIVTTVPSTSVPATTPPPVDSVTPMTWERIVDVTAFGGDEEQRMTDVATGDGVVVAVGIDGVDGDFDAAVWYSVDGVMWSRVPHDEAVFGGDGHQQMNAVVAVESGFIAVGSEGGDAELPSYETGAPSDSFEAQAAVWFSDDGMNWSRVPHADAFSDPDSGLVMNDVAFDGSGFVAVGGAFHRTAPFATFRWVTGPTEIDIDLDAAVWRSVDGVTWSRVNDEDEVFGGDTVPQRMNAVVAGGPGFVAVGHEGFDNLGVDEWTSDGVGNATEGRDHFADNVAAVWTSTDGEIWTRVTEEPSLAHSGGVAMGWAVMFDVSRTESGLVAVGLDFWDSTPTNPLGWVGGAAVWLSPDGLRWQLAASAGQLGEPDMLAVTSTGWGGLVAGGGEGLYGSPAFTWTSQDGGYTWVRPLGTDKLLFGGAPTNRAEDEAFGAASIRGLSTFDSNALAVGGFNDDAAVWVGTWNGGTDG
ncbi:MAG: hypothetical protein U9R51_06625 [Actinomycetota bacterium]|nr:hypothetical protein [Actinomycetota bacterium]